MKPDALDARIIAMLTEEPRLSVLAMSRRLGVARATVQSRYDRMQRSGAVSFAPTPRPQGLGFPVTAFISVEVAQTDLENPVHVALEALPEVVEIQSVSGNADLLVKVAARSNGDLQALLQRILAIPAVLRTSTSIALETFLEGRTLPLLEAAARERAEG